MSATTARAATMMEQSPSPAANEFVPRPAKILAVDDDKANLVSLRAILEGLGQPIVCARSGEEALRILLKDEFAIILLDVRMPGLDGFETATLIRGRERTRHVPIIFLSAIDKEERHQFRGYAAGAVDYVFKPIEPAILRAKVAVFVDLHAKTEEIRRQAEYEKELLRDNMRVRAERAETAEALRRSLEQQSLVIESLPIALFVASRDDPTRTRTFVGGNIARLLQLSEDEADGLTAHWSERLPDSDRETLEAAWDQLEAGGSATCEYRLHCGDGQYRWFSERLSLAAGGTSSDIVGVVFDISRRKLMEEQLTHAQKMEAIGQMTGSIAHDFNNMLSVIIATLRRATKQDGFDDKLRNHLGLALQAAESCAELTNRLLGFGRRQELEPRSVDVAEKLTALTALFERLLGNEHRVEIACEDGLWPAYTDPSQFEAAIVNLAINARDAMPTGGLVKITASNFSAETEDLSVPGLGGPGDYVEIQVIDSGTGMTDEVRKRALEPFFTTKEPGKGTGLGLSSIYDFVTQSRGGFAIESKVGIGTKIKVYLPRG